MMRATSWADSLRAEVLLYLGGRVVSLRDAFVMRFCPDTEEGRLRCGARDAETTLVRAATAERADMSPLQAQLGEPTDPPRALLVICHGIGEQLFFWRQAQQMLAEQGIASLVFHYAGYGESRGRGTTGQFEADAISACESLRALFPGKPLFLMGTSMGSAVAAHAAEKAQIEGLVLSQGFPTLREAAREMLRVRGLPPGAAMLLPDVWRTADCLRELSCPVLVIHGTADELFPVAMGETLFAAASARIRGDAAMIMPEGFRHSDVSLRPAAAYWQEILRFVSPG